MTRRLTSALVGALLAPALVALTIMATAAPAHADACSGSTGVTVVVDHNQLGAGVQAACDADVKPDGDKNPETYAAKMFEDAGFHLEGAQVNPGFVCRINELPAPGQDPCVNISPQNSSWSLYWSDGKSGTWKYATVGAYSLKVPDGGYVAFSWRGQASLPTPTYDPTPRVTTPNSPEPPEPTRAPDPPKSTTPATPGTPGATETTAPAVPGAPTSTPGAPKTTAPVKPGKPGKTPKPGKKTPSTAAPSATSTDSGPTTLEGTVTSDVAEDKQESGRLPWWLIVLVFAGLGGGAAVIAVQRKNASP